MGIARKEQEHQWSVRLDGDLSLGCAAELKDKLLEWLASGKNLELDLGSAESIDISILQLLYASGSEALMRGVRIYGKASRTVKTAAQAAGFEQVPGFPLGNEHAESDTHG
jgi:anti-anti-sigma regulatory factor